MFKAARINHLKKNLNKYGKVMKAIRRLGAMRTPEAVEALAPMLNHWSEYVHFEAAKNMGHDKRALDTLISLLGNSDLITDVIEYLGALGEPYTAEPLFSELFNKIGHVRIAAAKALADLGEPQWVGIVGGRDAVEDMLRIVEADAHRSVPGLVQILNNEDSTEKKTAAELLGKIRDPDTVGPLLAAAADNDDEISRSATQALNDMKAFSNYDLLKRALDNNRGSYEITKAAIISLGKLKDPRAVETLGEVMLNPGKYYTDDLCLMVRAYTPEVLGETASPRAVEILIAALDNTDTYLKQKAADALGELKDPRAVEPLVRLLREREPSVRKAAVTALGKLKDPRAVEGLLEVHNDPYIDHEWIKALGEIGDPRAVGPLIKKAAFNQRGPKWVDENEETYVSLISALGHMNNERTRELLIEIMVKAVIQKRYDRITYMELITAALALARLGEPKWADALRERKHMNYWYKSECLDADAFAIARKSDPRVVEIIKGLPKEEGMARPFWIAVTEGVQDFEEAAIVVNTDYWD